MREIQELLEAELQAMPVLILAHMVRAKFAAQNHKISQRTSERIARQIAAGRANGRIWLWNFWRNTKIDFTDEDLALLEEKVQAVLDDELGTLLSETTDRISDDFLHKSRKVWERQLRLEARDRAAFDRRLQKRWHKPLDSLRLLLGISREFGADFAAEVYPALAAEKPYLADILFRSQARACQVGEAVVTLLSHGFADDAMARWRSLHEIGATMTLLTEHGEALAERYVLHQYADKQRSMDDYAVCVREWGYEPMAPEVIEAIKRGLADGVARFGPSFKGWYGWAAEQLGKANPTFRDIEEAAGRAAWRATYKMASKNVHAGAAAIYNSLGMLGQTTTALAGPSNAGLADPGHATALALINVNMSLFPFFQTADSHVFAKIMNKLADEIGAQFLEAQQQLQNDENRYHSRGPNG